MFKKSASSQSSRRTVQLRYVLTPFAIIFVAIILMAIVSALAPKPEKKPILHKAPLVDVQPIKKQSITFSIASQGSISPRTMTDLIAEVSGKVTHVSEKFNVGGYFTKGETLLEIDDENYQIALIQAKAASSTAKANLQEEEARVEQAKSDWLLSGKSLEEAPSIALRLPQLQKAKASLKSAEAGVNAAKINLRNTKVKAPYDAIIQEKSVDIGQFASMGTPLAKTFAVDYAEVRLPVKQQDVLFLELPQVNQKTTQYSPVSFDINIGGQIFNWQAQLARYEGVVDSRSRVHYVIAQINDPYALKETSTHQELRMGSFINANIQGKTIDNVIAIPRDALHGASTIYTVDASNKLHLETISVLRSDTSHIYTLSDLPFGHRLITTMLETPVEGMKLRIAGEQENNKDKLKEEVNEEESVNVAGES